MRFKKDIILAIITVIVCLLVMTISSKFKPKTVKTTKTEQLF
jgi:hypothetical protein